MASRRVDKPVQVRTTGVLLVIPHEALFERMATAMVDMFKGKLESLEGKPVETIWDRDNWVEAARVAYIEVARAGGAHEREVPEVPRAND